MTRPRDIAHYAREIHMAVNVALRRTAHYDVPSCDGPDCTVCPAIRNVLQVALGPEILNDVRLEQAKVLLGKAKGEICSPTDNLIIDAVDLMIDTLLPPPE